MIKFFFLGLSKKGLRSTMKISCAYTQLFSDKLDEDITNKTKDHSIQQKRQLQRDR